jgi:hypothetical protein
VVRGRHFRRSRTTSGDHAAGVCSADGTWIGGSVQQWVEELTIAVNEYGAGGFVFFPVADTVEEAEKARATWAREIAPAVREGVQGS